MSEPLAPDDLRAATTLTKVTRSVSWPNIVAPPHHRPVEHPGCRFPGGIQIIGYGDSTETYSVYYLDSRGVSRRYEMSLSDGVWTMWRESPGFSQRLTDTFGDNGNTIIGRWEKSSDGSNSEHDLDLTYRRAK